MADPTRIRLITRGDDLGSFQAANQAIMDAFRLGILRNTSIMIPAPFVEQAALLAKQEPALCVGLHVTLNSEWEAPRWGPVAPLDTVPSLLDNDGYFFRTPIEMYEQGVNIEEMMREVRAQLERARSLGLNIRYIDEHMGVGWLFHPPEQKRLAEALRALALQENLIYERDLSPKFLLYESIEKLLSLLQELTAGTYLMVTHPACDSDEMRKVVGAGCLLEGELASIRSMDYRALCHHKVLQIIQERNIELISYDEVL